MTLKKAPEQLLDGPSNEFSMTTAILRASTNFEAQNLRQHRREVLKKVTHADEEHYKKATEQLLNGPWGDWFLSNDLQSTQGTGQLTSCT